VHAQAAGLDHAVLRPGDLRGDNGHAPTLTERGS
jgi:hypothetical protein